MLRNQLQRRVDLFGPEKLALAVTPILKRRSDADLTLKYLPTQQTA